MIGSERVNVSFNSDSRRVFLRIVRRNAFQGHHDGVGEDLVSSRLPRNPVSGDYGPIQNRPLHRNDNAKDAAATKTEGIKPSTTSK